MKNYKTLIFTSLFLVLTSLTYCQTNNINVINYKVKNGLSNNNINFIFQDNKGYIWIGTYNGLSRYDGYEFKNIFIQSKSSANSINHFKNYLKYNDTTYFVTTHTEGIFVLNTNKCSLIKIENSPSVSTSICLGKSGLYWIGTLAAGFFSYDIKSRKFKQILLHPLKKDFIYNWDKNTVNSIVQDPANDSIIWLGCRSGLKSYNVYTKKITDYNLYHPDLSHQLALNHVITLTLDNNTLWVGRFFGGLGKFDLTSKTFKNFFYNQQNFNQTISNDNSILKILNNSNNLWLATSAGIFTFDKNTETFTKYILHIDNTVFNYGVTCMMSDKFGNKWFGLIDQQGLLMSSPKLNASEKIIFPKQKFTKDYYGSVITDILYSKKYKSYFATVSNHDGLLEYSENFELKRQIKLPSNRKNYEPHTTELEEDDNGKIWILDITNSLICFDPKSGKYDNFFTDKFNSCETIISDQRGDLFFLTNNGLFKFSKNNWQLFAEISDMCIISNIRNRKLYFIDNSMVKELDIGKQTISNIFNLPKFSTENYNFVQSIYFDNKNRLWIPLEIGGIYQYDISNKKLNALTGKQGLNSNAVRRIIEDKEKRIFILCNDGLFYYDENSKQCIDFNNLMSSTVNNLYERFIAIAESNKLLLSKSDSFFLIDQSKVLNFTNSQPIVTSVKGINFDFFDFRKSLSIPDYANNLKISFTNFDFAGSHEIVYEYALSDSKHKWFELDKGINYVTLTGLAEGSYIFKVRIKGRTKVCSVKFRINVIWYKSKLFYILLTSLLVIIIISAIYYWQRKKESEEALLKKVAEFKLQAVQTQLNPHFLFNSLNSISALIKLGEYQKSEHTLNSFAKLMRLILNMSGEQLISLKHEIDLDILYLDIERLRKDYTFKYEIIHNNIDLYNVKVPPMLLQPFLENCIKHGFTYVKNKDEYLILISIKKINDKITIEITDNGEGENTNKKRIYEPKGIRIQKERLKQYKLTNNINFNITTGYIKPNGYRVFIEIS